MKKKVVLSFDLEFWYNSEFLKKYVPLCVENQPDYVLESTLPLLDLLKENGIRATFFVLGKLAEKYPTLIQKIFDEGHEIASHGYSHKSLKDLNEKDFEKEVVLTSEVLKKIVGQYPIWFRAPAFSLKKDNKWASDILKKHNLKNLSKRPIFSGGVYFRIMPLKLFMYYLKAASGNETPILYFHPYELFESAPKIESAPWLKRKIKYFGTKFAWKKFIKLMEKFDFISIQQYLEKL